MRNELRNAREEFAEYMMHKHCKEHHIDSPNHIIKDAFRIGFDEGIRYQDRYIKELWWIIVLLLAIIIEQNVFN